MTVSLNYDGNLPYVRHRRLVPLFSGGPSIYLAVFLRFCASSAKWQAIARPPLGLINICLPLMRTFIKKYISISHMKSYLREFFTEKMYKSQKLIITIVKPLFFLILSEYTILHA